VLKEKFCSRDVLQGEGGAYGYSGRRKQIREKHIHHRKQTPKMNVQTININEMR
jgi:hypothetical protein